MKARSALKKIARRTFTTYPCEQSKPYFHFLIFLHMSLKKLLLLGLVQFFLGVFPLTVLFSNFFHIVELVYYYHLRE